MTIVDSTSAPLVAVVGATGQQGGSVIQALKASTKPYRIRGFTRDPTKPAAQALSADGVEVFKVDLIVENARLVQTAFEGADIAFVVTNFWEHMSMQREIDEGKMIIDAAAAAGVKRIIWSGLQSIDKGTNGELKHVDHFESKWAVTEHGRKKFDGTDVAFVNVDAGLYMQNFSNPTLPYLSPGGDANTLVLKVIGGDKPLPLIDIAADYGKFVRLAIEDPAYATGGEILSSSDEITRAELISIWSAGIGKKILVQEETIDEFVQRFSQFGLPQRIALDLAENWASFGLCGYYIGKPSTKISEKTTTWKEFVAATDWTKVLKA